MTSEKILVNLYRLLVAIIILVIVYILRNILIPFALGGILAYALTPAARYLNNRGFSWKTSVLIIFLALFIFFIVIFFLVIPEAVSQFRSLTSHLPEYTSKIIDIAKTIDERYPSLGISEAIEEFMINLSSNLQSYLTTILSNIVNLFSLIMSIIFMGFVLTPFILYYFMADAVKIRRALIRLFPAQNRKEFVNLIRLTDKIVGNFIRGRLLVSLFVGVCVTIGLFLLNIEFSLVIGVIAGLLDIIPYLGPIIGAIPALIFAGTKSIWLVVAVALLFGGINLIEGTFIAPKFMGKEVGLHPVTVLFALLVGGELFGALGVIVSIPVAGVLKALYLHNRKRIQDDFT